MSDKLPAKIKKEEKYMDYLIECTIGPFMVLIPVEHLTEMREKMHDFIRALLERYESGHERSEQGDQLFIKECMSGIHAYYSDYMIKNCVEKFKDWKDGKDTISDAITLGSFDSSKLAAAVRGDSKPSNNKPVSKNKLKKLKKGSKKKK